MSDIPTYLGLAVSILTLAFLFAQTRALTKSVRTQSYQNIVGSQTSLDRIFLQYPELRPYLYGDEPLPGVDTEIGRRDRTLLDIALNVIDSTYQQRDLIPVEMLPSWLYYARETCRRPAVKQFLAENPDWYPFATSGAYDDELRRLEGR